MPPEQPGDSETAPGPKAVSITFEQAEEQAWSEIEQYLRAMNPYDLQELVASLLRAMGYHVSWIAPPGKDGGIDILAWSDPLGTDGSDARLAARDDGNIGGLAPRTR